jgi:hypothetical protein
MIGSSILGGIRSMFVVVSKICERTARRSWCFSIRVCATPSEAFWYVTQPKLTFGIQKVKSLVPPSPNIPMYSLRAYLFSQWFGFSADDDSRLNLFYVCCQHVAMFARLQIRSHLNSFCDVRQKGERAWECFGSHLDPWLPTAISARATHLFRMHSGQPVAI